MADAPPFDSWITALRGALGRPIEWDGQSELVLDFEGDIEVVLAPVPDTDLLAARSPLTFEGHAVSPAMLRAALELNYTRVAPGFTIALEPGSEQLVLLAAMPPPLVTQEAMTDLLAAFLQLVPHLRMQLPFGDADLHSRETQAFQFRGS